MTDRIKIIADEMAKNMPNLGTPQQIILFDDFMKSIAHHDLSAAKASFEAMSPHDKDITVKYLRWAASALERLERG